MMERTPDEIKRGLEHCINGTSCRGCPYCEECAIASDCNPMHKDLQEYVQQLEEFADKKIVELFGKAEQLEAERDAALADFKLYRERNIKGECGVYACDLCKIGGKYEEWEELKCPKGCMGIEHWQWRGVQKEE